MYCDQYHNQTAIACDTALSVVFHLLKTAKSLPELQFGNVYISMNAPYLCCCQDES